MTDYRLEGHHVLFTRFISSRLTMLGGVLAVAVMKNDLGHV